MDWTAYKIQTFLQFAVKYHLHYTVASQNCCLLARCISLVAVCYCSPLWGRMLYSIHCWAVFHLRMYRSSGGMESVSHEVLTVHFTITSLLNLSMTKLEISKRAPCAEEVPWRAGNWRPSTKSRAGNGAVVFIWWGERMLLTSVSHTFIVTLPQNTVTSLSFISLTSKEEQSEVANWLIFFICPL